MNLKDEVNIERKISIWTDGACRKNPGPGGWGVVIKWDGVNGQVTKELSGYTPSTTNNKMELQAAIEALQYLSENCSNLGESEIHLTTDSTYVKDGITKWILGWRKNGWKTKDKKSVKNADQWKKLDTLNTRYQVKWHWVRGHSGHPENERADKLATEASRLNSL